MILGVLISTISGQIIYSRVLQDTDDVRQIIKSIESQLKKNVKLESITIRGKYSVHRRVAKDLVIIIISDRKDPFAFRLSNELAYAYINLGVNADMIASNTDLKWSIKRIVDSIVDSVLISFESISFRSRELLSVLSKENCFELGISLNLYVHPSGISWNVRSEWQILKSRKTMTLSELIDIFMAGGFEEVLRKASQILGNEEYAKTLYVLAGILLNNMDPRITAVPLDKMISIINTLEDSLMREYLRLVIKGFIEYGATKDIEKFLITNFSKIKNILMGGDPKAKIYSIALSLFPMDEIIWLVKNGIFNKSPLMALIALSNNISISIINGAISKDKIARIRETLEGILERADMKNKALRVYTKAFDLLLTTLNLLFSTANNCESQLKLFYSKLDGFIKRYESKAYFIQNSFRGILYLLISIVLSLIANKEKAEKYRGYIQKNVRWIWFLGNNRRIFRDLYAFLITNLVGSYLRIMSILGNVACDVPAMLAEEFSGNDQEVFEANPVLFSYIVYGALSSLLWVSWKGIKIGLIRRKLSEQVLYGIDVALRKNYHDDLFFTIVTTNLIRIKKQGLYTEGVRDYTREVQRRLGGIPCVLRI